MHQLVRSLPLLLLLASCGGKSAKPTSPTGAATSIPAGIHGCTFTAAGDTYGPHRCDVVDGTPRHLDKLSGMELFTGTISGEGDHLTITAEGGCGDMGTACKVPFTIELTRDGTSWRGPVTTEKADWWLAGSTFAIDDAAGYGGEPYGGDGYGGE